MVSTPCYILPIPALELVLLISQQVTEAQYDELDLKKRGRDYWKLKTSTEMPGVCLPSERIH